MSENYALTGEEGRQQLSIAFVCGLCLGGGNDSPWLARAELTLEEILCFSEREQNRSVRGRTSVRVD